jgi:hypothetical protein
LSLIAVVDVAVEQFSIVFDDAAGGLKGGLMKAPGLGNLSRLLGDKSAARMQLKASGQAADDGGQ